MLYYAKNAFFGSLFGLLVIASLFCADCFDGNFTAHYGGVGVQEKSAFVVLNDQVEMFCRLHDVSAQRQEIYNKNLEGYALILANYRLKVSTAILLGSTLVGLLASFMRRIGGMSFSTQLKLLFGGIILGIAITTTCVEFDYRFNCVGGVERWTECFWSAIDLSWKCILLGLITTFLTTTGKKREMAHRALATSQVFNG